MKCLGSKNYSTLSNLLEPDVGLSTIRLRRQKFVDRNWRTLGLIRKKRVNQLRKLNLLLLHYGTRVKISSRKDDIHWNKSNKVPALLLQKMQWNQSIKFFENILVFINEYYNIYIIFASCQTLMNFSESDRTIIIE